MASLQDSAEKAAPQAAGNWLKFESFSWRSFDNIPDAENWTIVYTCNRDSGIRVQSNVAEIAKEMAPFLAEEEPDIREESHSHWAVGYVNGYAIRVYKLDSAGEPTKELTPAFLKWTELQDALEEYPLLNDSDASARVYDATLENIVTAGGRFIRDDLPTDWPSQVFSWFYKNDQSAVEDCDDQGGCPDDEQIQTALKALGFLQPYEPEEMDPVLAAAHERGSNTSYDDKE